MKPSILFVDDDQRILDGLRRMLRSQRNDWQMSFSASGKEALNLVSKQQFDAVVTDMRMPGMDGPKLLSELACNYPGIIRFVLSGHSDNEMIMQSVGTVHQYLSKPCDPIVLKSALTRALSLRKLLEDDRLMKVVAGISRLPVLPDVYLEIISKLQSDDVSVREIGETIGKDPAVTAKVLQLINSAFFGIGRKINNPADAASLLGLDVLKTLALSAGIFTQFDQRKIVASDFSIETVFSHCLAVGTLAKKISIEENGSASMISDSLLAGMLHDLGKLIMADEFTEEFVQARTLALQEGVSEQVAEREILGATHADLAAYLLALWGFSDDVVEAVAYHHQPARSNYRSYSTLTAIHVADVLDWENKAEGRKPGVEIDLDYLEESGLLERLECWKVISDEQRHNSG